MRKSAKYSKIKENNILAVAKMIILVYNQRSMASI